MPLPDTAIGNDASSSDSEFRTQRAARVESVVDSLVRSVIEADPLPRPRATYRVQLHAGFGLEDLTKLADYLASLGISDCYLSPYLQANAGSTHGYDVTDHGRINPDVGDEQADARLSDALRERGLGRVLDIVPNHMGIGPTNRNWREVLEFGPLAPSARLFDIDWNSAADELRGRVLLPTLEDQYGRVLEDGKLALEREGGRIQVRYHDRTFPVAARSYALILQPAVDEVRATLSPDHEITLEFESLCAGRALPRGAETGSMSEEDALREARLISRRLDRLIAESEEVRSSVDAALESFRGVPGQPETFDRLHEVLEDQYYRLASWKVASEAINYRRFFDVNELAGLRTEDPFVFRHIHERIFEWVDRGDVRGLRIDHPDGLADPPGYFEDLQEALFIRACKKLHESGNTETEELSWDDLELLVRARYRNACADDASGSIRRRFPVVAEKILSRNEDLPADWAIDGTVGYEFLNAIHGLFVAPTGLESVIATYEEFTGDDQPFADILYEAKQTIARTSLASELNMLARRLNVISEHDRLSRDFTLNELRRAIRAVVACFPVYRTYLKPDRPVADRDKDRILQAVARARRRNPTIDASIFAFIQSALLLDHPPGTTPSQKADREAFVTRFQQITGPVQAKGLEDTSFYRHFPLASLNEVGADPAKLGTSPQAFHSLNAHRLEHWSGGFNATSTHDTKRGEDTRIRIDALTELADEWKTRLTRWSWRHARKKNEVHGAAAPDAREEYLFYQSLIGSWPYGMTSPVTDEYVRRLQDYMVKAIREAKINTTWTDPDPSYAEAVARFVADVLQGTDSVGFLVDFLPFQARVARIGVVHSLAQALLKIASPGVPDIYQGCELWDLSLVDPDNRRPVDYDLRRSLLRQLDEATDSTEDRSAFLRSLLETPDDGAIKLHVIRCGLNHRKDHPRLYAEGNYRPLEVDGPLKSHVVAFARSHQGQSALVVVPRLVAGLMGDDGTTQPVGEAVWGETRLILPETWGVETWNDAISGQAVAVEENEGRSTLALGRVFSTLPLALLSHSERF